MQGQCYFIYYDNFAGIENENEPTWKEVKNMKDTLSGCSPTSPEGIELNLAKATKVSSTI